MKRFLAIAAIALFPLVLLAGEPRIVGPQTVNVGNPPWFELTVADVPDGALQKWFGPIGHGKIGFDTIDGIGVANVAPGSYTFKCRLQVVLPGEDEIVDLETTVTIVGNGPAPVPPTPTPPVPVPPVPPVPTDIGAKVESAVRALGIPKTDVVAIFELAGLSVIYSVTIPDGIQNGTLATPDAVLDATKTASNSILSGQRANWTAIANTVIVPYLDSLGITDQSPASVYAEPFKSIGAGIARGLK